MFERDGRASFPAVVSVTVGVVYSRPWCREWLQRELRKHLPTPFDICDKRIIVIQVGDIPPLRIPIGLHATVITVAEDMPIGHSRNRILAEADTQYLVWQDDDDWHSATRIDCLSTIRKTPADWGIGLDTGWTFDFRSNEVRRLHFSRPCAGTSIYNLAKVRGFRFDGDSPGSDSRWLNQIRRSMGPDHVLKCDNCPPHSLFIRHGFNTCIDPTGTRFDSRALISRIGLPREDIVPLSKFKQRALLASC